MYKELKNISRSGLLGRRERASKSDLDSRRSPEAKGVQAMLLD